jgi:hypothetical protein
MKFYRIDEMAMGSTGAGSIAAAPGRFNGGSERRDIRGGEQEWRANAPRDRAEAIKIAQAKAQLAKAKALKQAQRPKFRDFVGKLFSRNVSEAMDVAGVTSQLKGLENKNNFDNRNTVTYGVEDDEGNLMKVTVKSEDAKSFENRLALELGEIEDHKISGYQNSGISLAEVLYNMKDEFNIVDVEFPEIPSDIVYNADKASLGEQIPDPNASMGGMDGGMSGGPDDMGGMDDEQDGMPPAGGPDDMGGPPMPGPDGENPEGDDGMGMDDENMDQGEDFAEDEGGDDFKTMFNQLMQLMTAQAEKEKAIADAEAEKARALQAEYSAKAANHEVSRQEELVRMQAEMDAQKKKEKEAKQYADIAKYRVNRDKGSSGVNFEGYSSFIGTALYEDMGTIDGDLDTENAVRREIQQARIKYQITPTDDDPTKAYKAKAWQTVNAQLQSKLAQIRAKAVFDQKEKQATIAAAQKQSQQTQQTLTQQNQPQNGGIGPNRTGGM